MGVKRFLPIAAILTAALFDYLRPMESAVPLYLGWAWLVPLITAAVGYLGQQQANKRSKGERDAMNRMNQTGQWGQQTGMDMFGQGQAQADVWRRRQNRLANGTRQDVLSELSQPLSMMDQMNRTSQSIDAALAPRSGVSAERRLGVLDSGISNRNNMILGLQRDAGDSLYEDAMGQQGQASALMGLGSQNTTSYLGLRRQQRQDSFEAGRQAGQTAMNWANYLAPYTQGGGQQSWWGGANNPPQGTTAQTNYGFPGKRS